MPKEKKVRFKMSLRFAICLTIVVCASNCHGAGGRDDGLAYGDIGPNILKEDVTFHLFSSKCPGGTIITRDEDDMNTYMDAKHPTRIFVEGWHDGKYPNQAECLKKAYFNKFGGKVNLFLVEWEKGSHRKNLIDAVANKFIVAERVKDLLNFLMDKFTENIMSLVAVIGHNVGAHAAAIAGYILRLKHKDVIYPAVPFIFGIDPTMYEITEKKPLEECLDKSDADYVGIILTDASKGNSFKPYAHDVLTLKDEPGQPPFKCLINMIEDKIRQRATLKTNENLKLATLVRSPLLQAHRQQQQLLRAEQQQIKLSQAQQREIRLLLQQQEQQLQLLQ